MRNIRLKNRGIKRRRKNRQKRPAEWLILLSIFSILILGVKFYEFMGRGYLLRSIELKCRGKIDLSVLQNNMGLKPGANMLMIDLKKIANEMERCSKIKNVKVFRNLSEGKIEIIAEERNPFLRVIEEGTGRCIDVDEKGVVIGNPAEGVKGLIFVTVSSIPQEVEYSDRNSSFVKNTLQKAVQILKEAEAQGISSEEISEIDLRNPADSVLFSSSGIEFHLGTDELSHKLKRVKRLLEETRKQGMQIEYVDLRFEKEAVVKLKT